MNKRFKYHLLKGRYLDISVKQSKDLMEFKFFYLWFVFFKVSIILGNASIDYSATNRDDCSPFVK